MSEIMFSWRKYADDDYAHFVISKKWRTWGRPHGRRMNHVTMCDDVDAHTARKVKDIREVDLCPDCVETVQSLSKIALADNTDSMCESCSALKPRYRGLFFCAECFERQSKGSDGEDV